MVIPPCRKLQVTKTAQLAVTMSITPTISKTDENSLIYEPTKGLHHVDLIADLVHESVLNYLVGNRKCNNDGFSILFTSPDMYKYKMA